MITQKKFRLTVLNKFFLLTFFFLLLVLIGFSCSNSQQSKKKGTTGMISDEYLDGVVQISQQSSTTNSSIIQGMVRTGRLSVVGARVRIQGAIDYVTTNEQGRFELPSEDYPYNQVPVTVGKEGFLNIGAFAPKGSSGIAFSIEHIPMKDEPNYQFISPEPNQMEWMIDRMYQMMRGTGGYMMGPGMMGGRGGGMMGPGMMGRGMMGGGMMRMQGMENCGNCHRKIYDQWSQSTMAKSAKNPWVIDLYNGADASGNYKVEPGYRLDFPNSQGNCADCHAPVAAVRKPGRTNLNDVLRRGGVDAQGVSCDFCHKIQDVPVNNRPGVDGAISLDRQEAGMGMMMMRRVFAFGPYDDTVTPPMAASYSSLYGKSEYCSSCHQEAHLLEKGQTWDYRKIYPDGDAEAFEDGRAIPTQWTYQEWKEWQDSLEADHPDKGRKCPDCHTNWRKDMLPYYKFVVDGEAQQLMGVERDPQNIHPHHFEGRTEKQLSTAAYLEIDANQEADELVVTASVTNANSGHRLPTGIWMRNLILLVTATDENGKPLKFLRGETVPDWGGVGAPEDGNYAGLPGKGFARITADENGNINVPDWKVRRILSDNRIKQKQTDNSTYVFAVPKDAGEPTVDAKLIYRRAFKPLADAKKWKLDDFVMAEAAW